MLVERRMSKEVEVELELEDEIKTKLDSCAYLSNSISSDWTEQVQLKTEFIPQELVLPFKK